ncbi:MAG: FCD domain-containing protein [Burkholderiaceae bacterium]|nr:FCD domain-containing protein [Burkholderiaceae bacterium]
MGTVEHVAHELQQRIRRGEWKQGGRLPGQRQLAEELGVSRASLREAITMLEGLGLLRSEAGRGVFIALPGEKGRGAAYGRFQGRYALRDVYLLRSQVEELAAAMAADAVTSAGLARLARHVARMQAAADAGDLVAMAEADSAFHAEIFEIAGSPMLIELAESLAEVVEGSRRVAFADPVRVREPIREHARILDALGERSGKAARRAMRMHIVNAAGRAGVKLQIPGV